MVGSQFLQRHRSRLSITLVNLEREKVKNPLFKSIAGDATDPGLLADQTFDMVHSNSVIEHVGDEKAMRAYAENVRRLAPRYYVQTPNYWFPFEPHFRLPMFQYLPEFVRVGIIRRFAVGFFEKVPDASEAWDIIKHHQMISARQFARFFPDAAITFERFAGMNKSIMATRDFADIASAARLQLEEAPSLDPADALLDSANHMPPKTRARAMA
jgi:hypothetical protein